MPEYGVTDEGFVIKRLDTIMEEIHSDLSRTVEDGGLGVDTRLLGTSFLNTLITTFSSQIADLWETAQDSYYAKYPATAVGVNLDNAVQYGGIRRSPDRKTVYPLHCTGEDGTTVREGAQVATNTMPEIRLSSTDEFQITRSSFNSVSVVVAAEQHDSVYSVTINGAQYSYRNANGGSADIIAGLKAAINDADYDVTIEDGETLVIQDSVKTRSNVLILTENLTTSGVTTIANFSTEEWGRVALPYGVVSKMVNNIAGFHSVTNLLDPVYGRKQETDIELRQSYLAKSALRSNTMIESIVAELLNNVANVESASGYENDTDATDERGLPPHSIEIIVEGGLEDDIAQAILRRKAGGIQTYGSVSVDVPGVYGGSVAVHFNRPEYLYTWLKVVLHGDASRMPVNYSALTIQSLSEDGAEFVAGTDMLIQLLNEGIYNAVAGLTFVEILSAYSSSKSYVPSAEDYRQQNIMVTTRQKILLSDTRIEVSFVADS